MTNWDDPNSNPVIDLTAYVQQAMVNIKPHPALSMTTLEKEQMLKRYENIGLAPEEYAELRRRCGMPELIEGMVVAPTPEDDGYCGACGEFFLMCECGNIYFKDGKAYSRRLDDADPS